MLRANGTNSGVLADVSLRDSAGGRYRQFHQVISSGWLRGPDVDAELIALTARLWRNLGIQRVRLQINSLGTSESRKAYRELLVDYFRGFESRLDADSRRRLEAIHCASWTVRIPRCRSSCGRALADRSPRPGVARALRRALQHLARHRVEYEVNPRLVRGLDYYSRTVFEWINESSGAQNAVCSGGRYDGLIAQLGGSRPPL